MNWLKKNTNNVKLLIVEDDFDFRLLLQHTIDDIIEPKIESQFIGSVAEFEQLIKACDFDVILLDLNLSDSSGIDTFRKIRQLVTNTAIIVHSSQSHIDIIRQCINEGAQDYLIKGDFDAKLLTRSIQYSIFGQDRENRLNEILEWERMLFQNNPVPMFIAEEQTKKIINVNAAAEIQYGYSKEVMLNMAIEDYQSEEEKNRVSAIVQDTDWESGNWGIMKQLKSDGTSIYVDVRSNKISLNGNIYWLTSCLDVSESYKAEEELRNSEAKIIAMFNHTMQGYCFLDRDGKIILKNKVADEIWCKTFDRTVEVGAILSSFFEGEKHASYLGFFQRALNGETIIFERPYPLLSCGEIWLEVSFNPIISENKIIGVCHGLREITDKKLADQMIRESEANLRASLENTTQGYCLLDLEGRILVHNEIMHDVWMKLHSIDVKDGDMMEEMLSEQLKKLFTENFSMSKSGHSNSGEAPFIQINREIIWLEFTFKPVITKDGDIIGVCISGRDITSKKKYEENLRKSEANLRATLDNANRGYCLLDLNGRIIIKNKSTDEVWM